MDKRLSALMMVLAAAWMLLPAIQYFATVQRTRAQLGEAAPFEGLAALDLTWPYVILLACTALYAAGRAWSGRRMPALETDSGSPPHGTA